MEENMTQLDNRIAELRSKLNKMEMLSELEKTDIKDLARKLYFDKVMQGLNQAITDAIDEYNSDPMNCLDAANKILEDIGLEPISADGISPYDIYDMYISRF